MSTDNSVPNNSNMCSCGRVRTHCPDCGSHTIYATPTKSFMVSSIRIMAYRCRLCGQEFNDLERKFCKAPQFKAKQTKDARQIDAPTPFAKELEGLPREEQMRRIAERISGKH